jgi:hypothetical protein
MVEYMQSSNQEELEDASTEENEQDPHLMMLSAAALDTSMTVPRTMLLKVEIQGQFLLFLVDSGSSSCFIDRQKADGMSGRMALPRTMKVKVAGGAMLPCCEYFPALTWTAQGTEFQDDFKVLELAVTMVSLAWTGWESIVPCLLTGARDGSLFQRMASWLFCRVKETICVRMQLSS